MSKIKKLAGQTVIYGASSMIGRFLNFLLTPLYTFSAIYSVEQFGVITEMYAYVAFLVVFLTYGMETAFFRYSTLPETDGKKVYSNALYSLSLTTLIFIVFASLFSQEIADWLKYPNHSEYIIWFALIVGLDALGAVPQAKLRQENKAKKFALIQFANVGVNIGLNLFFASLIYSTHLVTKGGLELSDFKWWAEIVYNLDTGDLKPFFKLFYNPEIGVGYVFIANLIASIVKFLLLLPGMSFKGTFDWQLLKHMLRYSFPMLFVGLAGIINETLDRSMLKTMLSNQYIENGTAKTIQEATSMALIQLGIYGANYKITMIISMFIQAFRYAAEPFFFNEEKNKNSKNMFSKVMTYFVIVVVIMFLGINFFLPIFKYFTPNSAYWVGLKIIPILLLANIFLGIYVNQSIWYKLAHKTNIGALISIIGAIITITLNFIFIPIYGYVASAWATLICYGSMMLISYFLGRKYYPIPYDLKKVGAYLGIGAVLFFVSAKFDPYQNFEWYIYLYHVSLILLFSVLVYILEKPRKKLINSPS